MLQDQNTSIDTAKLAAYLRAAGIDLGSFEIRRLTGGQSNPTFLLNGASRRYVLRKKPAGKLLASAHAIEREYRVMAALAQTAVPVPKMLCLCEDVSILGAPFFLMSHVDGRVFVDPALPGMANTERSLLFSDINRVVAAIHSVDYQSVGLEDYGRPGNYLERQIGRWSKQYRASETDRIEGMERLMEWLPKNIPPAQPTALIHGELRVDNLIVHPTEPRVIGVIDWELSTLGDPLADLSYHLQMWRLRSDQFRGMADKDLPQLGIPSESEYLSKYCERTGRSGVDPEAWRFYMAFNLFRLVGILQGVLKRAIDGNAADDDARQTGQRARIIAEVGRRVVDSEFRVISS
jgi:aminoglycoside phosphotransferase (APT) family kinase protein